MFIQCDSTIIKINNNIKNKFTINKILKKYKNVKFKINPSFDLIFLSLSIERPK
jgi:hypothetical protein